MTWKDLPAFALFDDATWPDRGALLLEGACEEIVARDASAVPAALARLDACVAAGKAIGGYFSYELGYCLEPRLQALVPRTGRPLLRFAVFDQRRSLSGRARDRWLAELGVAAPGPVAAHEAITADAYREKFARIHDLIGRGDVYQVNLTFKLTTGPVADVPSLYRDLRERARAGGCALLHFADEDVLSFSPETFFVTTGRQIRVRPMKGTVARHPVPEEDRQRLVALQADPKQCAENLMIVDLMRNDLSRLCRPGSVRVDDMFTVETYPTYHTLTSTVTGELQEDPTFARIIPALFPCGSVTGAPKIRAMEIIRDTEDGPRGLYCGAVGHAAGNRMSFNVAIRTLSLTDAGGVLGIGGGIVWDSEPASEFSEARLKARFFTEPPQPFRLIETLRWQPETGFHLEQRHLARLAAGARHFGFKMDVAAVRAHLTQAVAGLAGVQRVRLTLGWRGDTQVEAVPLDPTPPVWNFTLSDTRVQSSDWRLYHKTTRREPYEALDRLRLVHPTLDEVVLVNERGELTEGCRSTLFIERDGTFLTPPVSSGLLDGCLRREMLETGPRTVEAVLRPEDLATGTVWLGNALRGLVRGRQVAL